MILTGDHIVGAQSGFDEYSRPQVNIKLDGQGGNKMANFTKDNVGKGHGDRLHRVQAGGAAWSGRQAQVPQAGRR